METRFVRVSMPPPLKRTLVQAEAILQNIQRIHKFCHEEGAAALVAR